MNLLAGQVNRRRPGRGDCNSDAIGVTPQHGLYTVIVAGFVIALTAGERMRGHASGLPGELPADIVVLQSMLEQLERKRIGLIVTRAEPRIIVKLRRAGIRRRRGVLNFRRDSAQVLRLAEIWRAESGRG